MKNTRTSRFYYKLQFPLRKDLVIRLSSVATSTIIPQLQRLFYSLHIRSKHFLDYSCLFS